MAAPPVETGAGQVTSNDVPVTFNNVGAYGALGTVTKKKLKKLKKYTYGIKSDESRKKLKK